MNEFKLYIQNRLNEFDAEKLEKLKRVKYILTTKQNYITWLFIMNFFINKKQLNVKELYKRIELYISRQSYFEILDNYVNSKIIAKINFKPDFRQKLIVPSMQGFLEFCEWSSFEYNEKDYNEIYSSIVNISSN